MKQLFQIKWTSTATEFRDTFNNIWRKLKKTGKQPEEWTIVTFICAHLPDSHDIIRKEVEDILDDDTATITVAETFQKIMDWKAEDADLESSNMKSNAAFATTSTNRQETRSCYNCKRVGHLRSQCRTKCKHLKCKDQPEHSGKDCPLRPVNRQQPSADTVFATGSSITNDNFAFVTGNNAIKLPAGYGNSSPFEKFT